MGHEGELWVVVLIFYLIVAGYHLMPIRLSVSYRYGCAVSGDQPQVRWHAAVIADMQQANLCQYLATQM